MVISVCVLSGPGGQVNRAYCPRLRPVGPRGWPQRRAALWQQVGVRTAVNSRGVAAGAGPEGERPRPPPRSRVISDGGACSHRRPSRNSPHPRMKSGSNPVSPTSTTRPLTCGNVGQGPSSSATRARYVQGPDSLFAARHASGLPERRVASARRSEAQAPLPGVIKDVARRVWVLVRHMRPTESRRAIKTHGRQLDVREPHGQDQGTPWPLRRTGSGWLQGRRDVRVVRLWALGPSADPPRWRLGG